MIEILHHMVGSIGVTHVDELFFPRDCFVAGKVDVYFRDEKLIKELVSSMIADRPFEVGQVLGPPKTDTAIGRFMRIA